MGASRAGVCTMPCAKDTITRSAVDGGVTYSTGGTAWDHSTSGAAEATGLRRGANSQIIDTARCARPMRLPDRRSCSLRMASACRPVPHQWLRASSRLAPLRNGYRVASARSVPLFLCAAGGNVIARELPAWKLHGACVEVFGGAPALASPSNRCRAASAELEMSIADLRRTPELAGQPGSASGNRARGRPRTDSGMRRVRAP